MNLFDLYAKITLDTGDYEKGLSSAKKTSAEYKSDVMKLAQTYKAQGMEMSDAMKKAYSEIDKSQYDFADNAKDAAKRFSLSWDGAKESIEGLAEKLKTGIATAAKVGAAGLAAAAAGVTALTKSSIEQYAEYEQLVGGVETLFKASSDVVQEYATNAYKTAGMSANEYMNTVTSFSASLLQSLDGDTAAAAEKANLAITDMSDNANKMGTSMEMIQNAYQGFAKQNYTMLDNLKLGYGGTKEEMQRLLDDAEKLSGQKFDLSSYGDIVDAIHVVQTEMGITGTTAKEASTTISGSVDSAKAAWQNLVTGIADGNADVGELTDNFVESVETAAGNILPVVDTVIENLLTVLEEKGPDIINGGARLFGKIAAGAIKSIPTIISSIPDIIDAIVQGFKESDLDIIEIGKDIVNGIWEGIKSMASWINNKVSDFVGGIVDGVKGVLGIHSPSRVFAGIGENMALGLGEGWDDEYGRISKNIKSGLDFGTASVDFSSSGLGSMSKSIAGGIANSGASGDIVINITQEVGGAAVARKQYRYNLAEAQRRGVSLVNT